MTDTNRAEPMKPCPFCRSSEIVYTTYNMVCWSCGAGGPRDADVPEAEAIAAWNRRAEVEASRLPLAGAAPSVSVVFGNSEPKGPCTVCGTPREKHGSYPTCATHPYTSDGKCQTVLGATCVGAECVNGCVRARGASPATGGNVIGRQRDALCMVLDIAQRRLLLPAEAAHVAALLAESDDPHREEREAYDRSMGAFFLADGSPRPDCASTAPSDAAVQPSASLIGIGDDETMERVSARPGVHGSLDLYRDLATSPLPTAPAGARIVPQKFLAFTDDEIDGFYDGWEFNEADPGRIEFHQLVREVEHRTVDALRAALAAAPGARQPLSDERIEEAWRRLGTDSPTVKGPIPPNWTKAVRWAEAEHGITLAPIAGKGDGK